MPVKGLKQRKLVAIKVTHHVSKVLFWPQRNGKVDSI